MLLERAVPVCFLGKGQVLNRASYANLPSLLSTTPQALLESTHKLLQIFEESESELKISPTNAVRNNRAVHA